jgi:alkylation response protein AidB-like acyl-CoA dehydrogenase
MEFGFPPEAEAFREKVQAFLAEHLPTGWKGMGSLPPEQTRKFAEEWRGTLRDNGYLALSWPREYGGPGLSDLETVILAEEFTKAGVPMGGANDIFGIQMLGNTLIRWGTEEQKHHFLPRILSGEDVWCQGYSEPDAGSDLASLGCRAEKDGNEWVINGQKIWTSYGHLANWIFVLCRTDPSAPKHRGISFLLCPMGQPGIEVRPIRMMSGEPEFNEVFFTDARCPVENVVGGEGNGWSVAMTLLGYERGETATVLPLRFREEYDRLARLAADYGRNDDPIIRQGLAWCFTKVEILRFLGYKVLTQFLAGRPPGPEASIFKLLWSEYHQRATELAVQIIGPAATVPSGRPPSTPIYTDDVGAPNSTASWALKLQHARAGTIFAGTSQVQRNIIGEQVLGLPKEPRPA